MRIAVRAPFVGRGAELDVLLGAVERVPAAGLVTVMVTGEAGIGKSSLLVESAERLGGRGWHVLRVRADRLERQIPYAALVTGLVGLPPADTGFTEGLRRDAIAALDLGPSAGTAEPPGVAFGRACAGAVRLLTALTAASPLVVAVDDLHELDDDSLALLAVVLGRLPSAPIGVLVALRSHVAEPNPAAHELVDRLADLGEHVVVELGVLTVEDLAAIIAPILGETPDPGVVAEVHRRADGNPYFAVEIARSMLNSTVDSVRGTRLTRRATVLRRVLPLTASAWSVARSLAVLRRADLGRLALIAGVTSLPPAAVTAAFDDLVRADVVTGNAERGYRFAHDIIADAVYDEIGPAEARRLHRLVAGGLLEERDEGRSVDLLELAWHTSESALPGEAPAIAVLAEAARYALHGAPEASAALCARALALMTDDVTDDLGQRGNLLALRCRALARAGRPAAAVPAGRAALALLPAGEEWFRTGTAVLSSLFISDRIEEAMAVADEQVRAPNAPAALHAQRAVLLVFSDREAEALDEAATALAALDRTATAAEEVVVCGQLAMLTSMLFRHGETVEFVDRAVRASGDSTTLRLQALGVGASTEALAGLVGEATRRLRLAEQLTRSSDGTHPFGSELAVARVVVDWLSGRWDAALLELRTLTVELGAREYRTLAGALTAVELEIRTRRGELVLGAVLAARPRPRARNVASLHAWALAGFLAARGDVEGACDLLTEAMDRPGLPTYAALLLSRLAELESDRGKTDRAERAVRELAAVSADQVSPWALTSGHRTVGVARRDGEMIALSVAEADAGGLAFELAQARLALGELDPSAEGALLDAHATFARLGAHALRRRAARRLHELGAKVPRVSSRAAGLLTESEERVARLVQQGMRNREIATALHYSARSVEVYLSRIYAKLRVSSRLELARALDAMDAR